MEGINPYSSCPLGCHCSRGWVPMPLNDRMIRRNPLKEAIAICDNPCVRPARNEFDEPVPQFRSPQDQPLCCLNDYLEELKGNECTPEKVERLPQLEKVSFDNVGESCESHKKLFAHKPQSKLDICKCRALNQRIGSYIQAPSTTDELKPYDIPCKTNILVGIFNPNENKTRDEVLREACDPFYQQCKPVLPPYPCRGVIDFPPQKWARCYSDVLKSCAHAICDDTKYKSPAYLEEEAKRRKKIMEKQMFQRRKLEQQQRLTDADLAAFGDTCNTSPSPLCSGSSCRSCSQCR